MAKGIKLNSIYTKTILITGSRGGIGRDAAVALAKRGHKVIATVHLDESVEDLKEYAKKHNVSFEVFKLDITSKEDVQKLENVQIDILINNAGIGESGPLSEIPIQRVRNNFEVNVFSTLELTQTVLKAMIARGSGRVIFISSLAGRMVMPYWGTYNMTKFALSAAADVMRQEIKEISNKVFISVIEPGTYHTGFNQRVVATKYEWLDNTSHFFKIINKIKNREDRLFKSFELQSTDSIVKKIVKAVEDEKPRLRYSAPWWQTLFVRAVRMLGR